MYLTGLNNKQTRSQKNNGYLQTDLARHLCLSDGRRIRQWLSGDRPIPDGIWKDIARLLTERKSVIDDALDDLLKIIPTNT